MYAIIETSGKQYKVSEGEKLWVDKVPGVPGQAITFTRVLMIGGETIQVGKPILEKASVSGEIVADIKDKKIIIFKKKKRKGYQKKQGHRQKYTEVLIKKIVS
ncbi:MAG: 50S ribosomal protein L21 [Deltaproteobacteria bacterium]|nr:50S ribosomal protein L21 [Deltaproteobacteria bacterium]